MPAMPFAHFDKVLHFFGYGLLALLIVRLEPARRAGLRGALLVVLFVSLFGALDEWRQQADPRRTADVADWVADTLGAAAAVTVYQLWLLRRRSPRDTPAAAEQKATRA